MDKTSEPSHLELQNTTWLPSSSRRNFLLFASWSVLGYSSLLGAYPSYAQTNTQIRSSTASFSDPVSPTMQLFRKVASFLCARPHIDPALSAYALQALQTNVPDFALKLRLISKLQDEPEQFQAIMDGSYIDTTEVKQNTQASLTQQQYREVPQTVKSILRALYIGSIGEGENARLISYEQAFMFSPTQHITVIPSYARAGYNYWTQPSAV